MCSGNDVNTGSDCLAFTFKQQLLSLKNCCLVIQLCPSR